MTATTSRAQQKEAAAAKITRDYQSFFNDDKDTQDWWDSGFTDSQTFLPHHSDELQPDSDVLNDEAYYENIELPEPRAPSSEPSADVTPHSPSPELFEPPRQPLSNVKHLHSSAHKPVSKRQRLSSPETQGHLIDDTQNHPFYHPPLNASNADISAYTAGFSNGKRRAELLELLEEVEELTGQVKGAVDLGDVVETRRAAFSLADVAGRVSEEAQRLRGRG